MTIQRDKSLRDYNSNDFVKYFSKKFLEANRKDCTIIFARDCSIMLKIMRKFFDAKKELKEIFTFIDEMFIEYPKRRRVIPIDINWLYGVVDIYLHPVANNSKSGNKVKAPEVKLDADMKAWLEEEKKKWLK
jgi:hypothetical protein